MRTPILASLEGPPTPPPGKVSDYIYHADSEILPSDPVVLWCRVSDHTQEDNLADQDKNLRRAMERLGAVVVGVVHYVGTAKDGCGLIAAANIAKELGAKLVTETPNRFIRHEEYSKRNQNVLPTEQDLQFLLAWTEGVTLVTLLHPDATPGEERSYQTMRGQAAKDNYGGRPRKQLPGYKRDRCRDLLPFVMRLREQGMSVRKIAVETGVPRSTIQDWIRRYGKES